MSLKSIKQRGDTIVEVMISIAVIGTVLAGAYATANSSLTNVRDAQEHEEATNLASSQAETLGVQPLSTIFPSDFCFNALATGSLAPITTTVASPVANCSSQGSDQLYTVNITQVHAAIGSNLPTYEINVNWDRLSGGNDNIQLYYQPLPGN